MQKWQPESWQTKTIRQIPDYPSAQALDATLSELANYPPLVTPLEIKRLKQQLANAAAGKAFILQGGDCAESFAECRTNNIINKTRILLQMSLILLYGLRKPIVRVGRIAGQFAKPRSEDVETRDGETLTTYRGDIINQPGFSAKERTPDPQRILTAYNYAARTLNLLRALGSGGFADLQHPENWDLDFMKHSPLAGEYHKLVDKIEDVISFIQSIPGMDAPELGRVDFFTSHEALLLPYEQALTHCIPDDNGTPFWYNLSAHLPWVGMRTADPDSAHIEYLRGINNPIAIKVGPRMTREWLLQLLDILHPDNEPGRITLIHRFGADTIKEQLPPMLDTVKASGKTVLWLCDPMHGNTEKTQDGIKTRRFDNILSELTQAFDIHVSEGTLLGGVHFELTGDNVTECTGGARGLSDKDLHKGYKSLVDPRLNYEQSLEMAMLIAKKFKG